MIEVADLYDPAIPPTENEPYMARIKEIRSTWMDDLNKDMQKILRDS